MMMLSPPARLAFGSAGLLRGLDSRDGFEPVGCVAACWEDAVREPGMLPVVVDPMLAEWLRVGCAVGVKLVGISLGSDGQHECDGDNHNFGDKKHSARARKEWGE